MSIFIGGPLDGRAAGYLSEPTYAHTRPLGRGEIHRTHLCHSCGYRWRPADVTTNGVAAVKTKGKDDDPIVTPKRGVPNWEAVKGKRMSELTPAQQDDAQELWLRNNVGYFTESVEFLLRRLDAARGAK